MTPAQFALPLALIQDMSTDVIQPVITTVVIGVVAIAMLMISIIVVGKVLPFDVHHELSEDHNVAAGIVVGSVVIGVAIVIAAVAQG